MTAKNILPTALHAAAVATQTTDVAVFYWGLLYAEDRAAIAAIDSKWDALEAFDAAMDRVPLAIAAAASN
jgi:hypothetical protein